jgi:hypothetical protein
MMVSTMSQNNTREGWIRVFCPDTRCLTPEEISGISAEERRSTEADKTGAWLEVKCPEGKCLIGENRMTITVRGVVPREDEGLWHKLFCPEDRCFAQSPTDLP